MAREGGGETKYSEVNGRPLPRPTDRSDEHNQCCEQQKSFDVIKHDTRRFHLSCHLACEGAKHEATCKL